MTEEYVLIIKHANGSISRQIIIPLSEHSIKVQSGDSVRIVKVLNGKEALLDDLIAQQHGNNIALIYTNGLEIQLEDFYSVENTTLYLPGEEEEFVLTSASENITTSDDVTTVYAHGNSVNLMQLVQGNQALESAIITELGSQEYGVVTLESTTSGLFSSNGFFGSNSLLSVAGIAAVVGIGGGGSDGIEEFTVNGNLHLGPITSGVGLTLEVYSADGRLLGSGSVSDDGRYSVTVTEDYSGPILIRVVDKDSSVDYLDEATGEEKDVSVDLRAVTVIAGAGDYLINLNPATELATRKLLNDSGGDEGNSATTLGSHISSEEVLANNENVATALGLGGVDIITTVPAPVNGSGYNTADDNAQSYGQILAAISGVETKYSKSTNEVLNDLISSIKGSTLDQSEASKLIAGAKEIKDANGDPLDLSDELDSLLGSTIGSIKISADLGVSSDDLISNTAIQDITATLDRALTNGELVWGSVDSGETWTQVTVLGTVISWDGVTLTGSNAVQFALTAAGVASTDVVANTLGNIASESYIIDLTPPVVTSVVINATDSSGVVKTDDLHVGDQIMVTVIMSENVIISDVPSYTLNVGGVNKAATYVSGSETDTLIFSYTLDIGDLGGITASTDALALNGGTLKDSAGNDANLITPIAESNTQIVNDAGAIAAISGTVLQGETLTAGAITDEDGISGGYSVAATYQWQADGVDIATATGATYVLSQAEVGKKITVVATYTDAQGTQTILTSAATSTVANMNDTGTIEDINGTATEGETLTAGAIIDADGISGGHSVAATYQWQADGVDIATATEATYVLEQAEVGKKITVVATYTDAQGTQETLTSAATSTVANVNDTGTIEGINGTATEGETLTAGAITDEDGISGGYSVAATYQWQADGVDIATATGATYVLSQAEVGKKITVVATYTDAQGTQEILKSAPTDLVIMAPTIATLRISDDDVINGDDIANAVVFRGTTTGIEDGQTVIIVIAGISVEVEVNADSFSGTVDLSGVSDNAALAITADVSDVAGNAAMQFTSSIVLDTLKPAPPKLTLADDTGTDADDQITSSPALTLADDDAASTVEYHITPPSGIAGVWTTSYTPPVANGTADGDYTVKVRQTDTVGNISDEHSITFTLDSVKPTIAISSDVSELKAGETATITFTLSEPSTDFVESDVSMAGGTLSNFSGSGTHYTATFTPTVNSNDDGVITVVSDKFSDAAGNNNVDGGENNNAVTLTVDTEAPVAPTVALKEDTGTIAGRTYNNTVNITDLEEGASWEYSLDGGTVWIDGGVADATGVASFELVNDTEFAANDIQVRQTDETGNISEITKLGKIITDNTLPDEFSVALSNDSGRDDDDNYTNDGSLKLYKVTAKGDISTDEYSTETDTLIKITLTEPQLVDVHGELITRVEVEFDSVAGYNAYIDGKKEVADNGEYRVQVDITDGAGNVRNDSLTFELDTISPESPSISLTTDSGLLDDDKSTNDASVTVGNIGANSDIEFSLDGGASWHAVVGSTFDIPLAGSVITQGRSRSTMGKADVASVGALSGDIFLPDSIYIDTTTPSEFVTDTKYLLFESGSSAIGTAIYFINGKLEIVAGSDTTIDVSVDGFFDPGTRYSILIEFNGAGEVVVYRGEYQHDNAFKPETLTEIAREDWKSSSDTQWSDADGAGWGQVNNDAIVTALNIDDTTGMAADAVAGQLHQGNFFSGQSKEDVWTDGETFTGDVIVRQKDQAGNEADVVLDSVEIDQITPQGDSIVTKANIFTLKLNKMVDISGVTIANLAVSNSHSLGTNATVEAADAGPQKIVISGSSISNANGTYTQVTDPSALTLIGQFDPYPTEDLYTGTNTIDINKPVYQFTNSLGENWYIWARDGSGYHVSMLEDFGVGGGNNGNWLWEASLGPGSPFANNPVSVVDWRQANGAATPTTGSSSIPDSGITTEAAVSGPQEIVISGSNISNANGTYTRVTDPSALTLTGQFDPYPTEDVYTGTNTIDINKPVYQFTNSLGENWYIWARDGSGYHVSMLEDFGGGNNGNWLWEASLGPGSPFANNPVSVADWRQANGAATPTTGSSSIPDSGITTTGYSNTYTVTLDTSDSNITTADTITIAKNVLEDKAGNQNEVIVFTVPDLTVPNAPTAALENDSGRVDSDGITNDKTVMVSGLETGGSWAYSVDGGVSWTSGVGSSFELDDNREYANTQIQVRQSNSAGAQSEATKLGGITIDNTPPVNNVFIDDVITELPTITGKTSANIVVEIKLETDNNDRAYDDATYTVTSDGNGNWSLDLSRATPDSDTVPILANINTELGVQVKVTDTAGNIGTQEIIIFGTTGDDMINLSLFNETVYGRGGDDTFVYKSWSDARTDDIAVQDTIVDFTVGGSSGDRIDLSDLLTYSSGDTLADFIQILGGSVDGGDVTINIDKEGDSDFSSPEQIIVLTDIGSNTTPVTLDLLDDYHIILG